MTCEAYLQKHVFPAMWQMHTEEGTDLNKNDEASHR